MALVQRLRRTFLADRISPRRRNIFIWCWTSTPPLSCNEVGGQGWRTAFSTYKRSEEHTSELQSQFHLVCRLLLEKKHNGGAYRPRGDCLGSADFLSRTRCLD